MPLPKHPYPVSADQVHITREGDHAIIEYADPTVPKTHLHVGAEKLSAMTDDELLQFWNDLVEAGEEQRRSLSFTATEIPVGKPQVQLFEPGNQWTPRGHVLRCQILGTTPSDLRLQQGSQFVIATHAPILLAYPEAWIYELDEHGLHRRAYDETSTVRVTREFLSDREGALAKLFADG